MDLLKTCRPGRSLVTQSNSAIVKIVRRGKNLIIVSLGRRMVLSMTQIHIAILYMLELNGRSVIQVPIRLFSIQMTTKTLNLNEAHT